MAQTHLALMLLIAFVTVIQALVVNQIPFANAAPTTVSFLVPTSNGGSFLDNAGDGFGEPLNVRLQYNLLDVAFKSKIALWRLHWVCGDTGHRFRRERSQSFDRRWVHEFC